jgi:hypothetical protein
VLANAGGRSYRHKTDVPVDCLETVDTVLRHCSLALEDPGAQV